MKDGGGWIKKEKMMKRILEVCAADIDSVHAAARGGAARVELCCALGEGGLTPSAGMIEEAMAVPGIKVNVLIRPRPGDFLYSEAELRIMLRDINICREMGVNGVVFGALKANGEIDIEACCNMAAAAEGLHKTFHRAFDMCRDPYKAAKEIIEIGCDRILTSGQASTAMKGASLIGQLQTDFPEIIFIAAGGVNPDNAAEIAALTRVSELHASAKSTIGSAMTYRNSGVNMGVPGADEFSRITTDSDIVKRIIDKLQIGEE